MQPPAKLPRLDGLFDQTVMPPMGAMPPVSMLGANPLGAGALGLGALGGLAALPGVTGLPGVPPAPGLPGVPTVPGVPPAPSLPGAPPLPLPPANLLGGAARMGNAGKMGGMMPGLVYANMAAAAAMTLASMGQDDTSSEEEDEEDEVQDPFDKDLLARLAKQAAEKPDEPAEPPPQSLVVPPPPPAPAVQDHQRLLDGTVQPSLSASLSAHLASMSSGQQAHQGELQRSDLAVDTESLGGVRIPPPSSITGIAQESEATHHEASDSDSPGTKDTKASIPAQSGAWSAATVASAKSQQSEGIKKDDFSVANLLQQVQSNVARGRAGGGSKKPGRSVQDVFGMEQHDSSSSSMPGGLPPSSGGSFDALLQRLDQGGSPAEVRLLEADVLQLLPSLEPSRAVELIFRVHLIEACRSIELLDAISKIMTPFVVRLGSPHLARLMGTFASWAIVASGSSEDAPSQNMRLADSTRAFFGAASKEVSVRLMDVVTGDLGRIASSLASVGLGEPVLFGSIARAATARIERFSVQDIISLAGAFDKAGLVHTALFEALARNLRAGFREIPARDLIIGLRALATCGIREKELGHSVCMHLLKLAQQGDLPPEEFCALAWNFCALDLYHDKIFRSVFRALEGAAVVSSETLCQLYEIHVTLKAFHEDSYKEYMLEAETVQGLCEHYRKHKGGKRWEMKHERASEKVHKDIAETLDDVLEGAAVHRQHQTALGFIVDTVALRKKNSSAIVVVDVDGPLTLMRSLDPSSPSQSSSASRVRGSVMMKRRVLQRHGYRICVLSEDIWRTLDDGKEKRDFMREMLKTAGVSAARLGG